VVAVLLPFRNSENTLAAAIASIMQGSYRDLELLLIDNASTDASADIAREWCGRDPRIRLIHEPAAGIARALNTGLANTSASLIARMDADDVSHPERLSRQVPFMHEHPEIGVLGTRTRFETTVARSSGMRWFVDWQNSILDPHEHYVKRFVDAPLAHPTVMFRRELVERFGGYSTAPLPEDHELWLRWMHNGVGFAKLPEELLTWNDNADRLSRTHANYSTEAFFVTKVEWLAAWIERKFPADHPVIVAGTSGLCRERARLLEGQGITLSAFTDVKPRKVPGHAFIAHDRLPKRGDALIVSFISQRGTGDRIADYFRSLGLVEGEDFVLGA
jgi:glycosyltransferase involved in cell wall biosynthesis